MNDKAMKVFCVVVCGMLLSFDVSSQSLVGTWQLIKQTTCLEDELEGDEGMQSLLDEFSEMSSPTPQTVTFNANQTFEVAVRELGKKKTKGSKSLLYKQVEDNLFILDKKSQTIRTTYHIEKLTSDSLIYTNSRRACETRIFVRTR